MQRHLTLLRDALARVGGQRPDDSSLRSHERARAYYGLLSLPADGLLAALEQSRQLHFTSAEMGALLQVGGTLGLWCDDNSLQPASCYGVPNGSWLCLVRLAAVCPVRRSAMAE